MASSTQDKTSAVREGIHKAKRISRSMYADSSGEVVVVLTEEIPPCREELCTNIVFLRNHVIESEGAMLFRYGNVVVAWPTMSTGVVIVKKGAEDRAEYMIMSTVSKGQTLLIEERTNSQNLW